MRGYAFQSLGPGRYLMTGSIEYQHRLINDFYGAIFFDAGNAVNNFPINLKKGSGLGLVWASPLGPMEITAAGMDADTVMPTRRPRYALAPPKITARIAPRTMDTTVSSGITLSAGI